MPKICDLITIFPIYKQFGAIWSNLKPDSGSIKTKKALVLKGIFSEIIFCVAVRWPL